MSPLVILSHVPLWVWLLLALLVLFGLRATRERSAPVWLIALPTLLVLLALRSVHALATSALPWLVFALAYAIGSGIGARLQPRWTLGKSGSRVRLAGEWLTFALMMVLFALNFASGVLQSVAPLLVGQPGFGLSYATLAGLASGVFLGRAVYVIRRADGAPAAP